MPSITGLAIAAALNAVENKIRDASDLVKKKQQQQQQQIMIQKYQTLRVNISPHLIIINFQMK